MSRIVTAVNLPTRPVDRVSAALQKSFISAVKTLKIEEDGHGRIILRGNVARYYDKQMAQEIAMDTLQGEQFQIDNRINVPRTTKLTDF